MNSSCQQPAPCRYECHPSTGRRGSPQRSQFRVHRNTKFTWVRWFRLTSLRCWPRCLAGMYCKLMTDAPLCPSPRGRWAWPGRRACFSFFQHQRFPLPTPPSSAFTPRPFPHELSFLHPQLPFPVLSSLRPLCRRVTQLLSLTLPPSLAGCFLFPLAAFLAFYCFPFQHFPLHCRVLCPLKAPPPSRTPRLPEKSLPKRDIIPC